jgi:ferritin-like metal-binding protein YciE
MRVAMRFITRGAGCICATSWQRRVGFVSREVKMGWLTSKTFDSLDDLFLDQLADLYDAENRLVDALPKMAEAASNPALRRAFEEHLEQTRTHVQRLESVAMKGLISEGEEMIDAQGDADVRDAALIAAAQRVEHYEIAAYGTVRTFAQHLGYHDAARLLESTLDEESETDRKLTQIAEASVNLQAQFA